MVPASAFFTRGDTSNRPRCHKTESSNGSNGQQRRVFTHDDSDCAGSDCASPPMVGGTGGCRSTEDSFRAAETSRARSTFSLDTGHWRTYDGRWSAVGRRSAHPLCRDGAAWFATGRGAARFDGRQFQSVSRVDGLLDDSVFPFAKPRWCAVAGGAAGVGESGWAGCELRPTNGLTGGEVFDIEQAPDDRIWFALADTFAPSTERFESVPGVSKFSFGKIQPLAVGRDGTSGSCQRIMANSRWNGREMQAVATGLSAPTIGSMRCTSIARETLVSVSRSRVGTH